MRPNHFPPGWDEERVQRLLAYYEIQSEEDVIAEDENAFLAQNIWDLHPSDTNERDANRDDNKWRNIA